MHRYYHSVLPNWSPWWLVMVWCAIIAIIGVALHQGSPHHEPGVRHALPDPYVPQCYAIIELGGGFCQFRL
jgi:hypothetical protein